MSQDPFDVLTKQLREQGVEAFFDGLVDQLKNDRKHHELFDVLLMRSRRGLGLPADIRTINRDAMSNVWISEGAA